MKKEQLTLKDLKKELLKEYNDNLSKSFADTGPFGPFHVYLNNKEIFKTENHPWFTTRNDVDNRIKELFENTILWNYKEWSFSVKWDKLNCYIIRTKFGKPF